MSFLAQLSFFLLITIMLAFIAAHLTLSSKGISFKEFVKGKNGAIASASLAFIAISLMALLIFILPNNANAGWFNDAGVYMGLDYTKKRSPQCERGDPIDEHGTSNLGAWGNIWESERYPIRVNAKYTHHSCFVGEDDKSYDGGGLEVEWTLYRRKK